jgi:protoporphyrinogen oxidase
MRTTRREFLTLMGTVAASSLTGVFRTASAEPTVSSAPGFRVSPWTGDDYTLGHRLRDGFTKELPLQSEKKVEFVIVGGGMAGLACSHYLRNENILLLEQYDHMGGTSSGGSYKGIDYSMGAVCTGSYSGIYKELFDELKIQPTVVPKESVAWRYAGEWLTGLKGTNTFYKEFDRLSTELHAVPAATLEKNTFSKFLTNYDPEFASMMDHISRSWYGAGADEVAGTAGMGVVDALSKDSYVFKGGNSGIARALSQSLEGTGAERIKTSAFVWRVEKSQLGASVVYSDKDGAMHRVDARHVVVATPPMITRRIVAGLSDTISDSMSRVECAAMVVANFCLSKKVFKSPFQSYADASYPFGQMVLAESPYELSGSYRPEMGSVLTVYVPYCTGAAGRVRLLAEQREHLAESLVSDMNRLVDGFDGALEQVVLTRWGHAFPIPRPGVAQKLAQIKDVKLDWMTFAHSTATGSQSLEGAIQAARRAADLCLRKERTS